MFEALVDALETIHSVPRDQGDDSVGCRVHCDIRPANVTTKGPSTVLAGSRGLHTVHDRT